MYTNTLSWCIQILCICCITLVCTAPLRTTSSANTTPTTNRRTTSPPPISGLANCLTSSSPSTSNPSTPPVSSPSAGNSPVGVMKKAATIPKIVTPTSSPGVQRKESYQGWIVRATITLYPIGRPFGVTITLYPIGRPVRATITLYPIGRLVRLLLHCIL